MPEAVFTGCSAARPATAPRRTCSYSPYGIVGPKGMDPQLVRALHGAFKRALDDPEHLKLLQQLDQVYWYKTPEVGKRGHVTEERL